MHLGRCHFHAAMMCWLAFGSLGAAVVRAADTPPLERVATIPLKGPAGRLDHLALDARHHRLFVANMANSSLDIVDLKAGQLIKQIPGQKGIQGIAYADDLDRIFVGVGEVGVCNVFDGKNYQLLKSFRNMPDADNVRYDPRSHHVYVAHAEHALAVLDGQGLTRKGEIRLPGSPESFQLDRRRSVIYLNSPSPSQVVEIDPARLKVIKRWPLTAAQRNFPMALDEAHGRLFIGCRQPPRVLVLDTTSGKNVASVPIPGDTDDLWYDARHGRVYASCGAGYLATLRQKDADHYEPMPRLATVKLARTCLFDPGASRLYVLVPRRRGTDGPQVWVYNVR